MWWDRAKQFLSDASGAAFIYVGLMMAVVTGFVGLSVDVGFWYSTQRSAQVAADAAAVAGAFEVYWGGDATKAERVARDLATENGFDNAAANVTVTVNNPPLSGPLSGVGADLKAVEVIIEQPTPGLFSSIFQQKHPIRIKSRAVAARVAGTPSCMVALAPSGTAIFVNSDSTIDASGCGIHVNSDSPGAVETNGVGSAITAQELYINPPGTATGPNITSPQTSPPLPDPMAYLQLPSHLGDPCHALSGQTLTVDQAIDPAVYCDLVIDSGAVVTLNSGTYIFKSGKFEVNSGSRIETVPGAGVTLVAAEGANITLNSTTTADLEGAPLTGEFPGVLFYQLRDPVNLGKNLLLNSDTGSRFIGAIYYPMGKVVVNSASSIGGLAPFSSIVADTIEVNSSSHITLNTNFSGSTVPDVPTLGAYRISLFE